MMADHPRADHPSADQQGTASRGLAGAPTGSGGTPAPPSGVPDYLLEQYALGELPAPATAELDRRLASDEALRVRLARLRASNAEILARHPAGPFAVDVERRLTMERSQATSARAGRGPASRRWLVATPALAVAAVVLLLLVRPGERNPSPGGSTGQPVAEMTRSKGDGAYLCLYRHVGERVDTLADRQIVQQGDVLQLSYVPMGRPHGVIVSIDGRGAVTLHFPASATQSTRLGETGETLLPHAYELDDAPDFERFFLITGGGPVDVESVLAAARLLARSAGAARTGPLALPDSLEQTSFVACKKESSS